MAASASDGIANRSHPARPTPGTRPPVLARPLRSGLGTNRVQARRVCPRPGHDGIGSQTGVEVIHRPYACGTGKVRGAATGHSDGGPGQHGHAHGQSGQRFAARCHGHPRRRRTHQLGTPLLPHRGLRLDDLRAQRIHGIFGPLGHCRFPELPWAPRCDHRRGRRISHERPGTGNGGAVRHNSSGGCRGQPGVWHHPHPSGTPLPGSGVRQPAQKSRFRPHGPGLRRLRHPCREGCRHPRRARIGTKGHGRRRQVCTPSLDCGSTGQGLPTRDRRTFKDCTPMAVGGASMD